MPRDGNQKWLRPLRLPDDADPEEEPPDARLFAFGFLTDSMASRALNERPLEAAAAGALVVRAGPAPAASGASVRAKVLRVRTAAGTPPAGSARLCAATPCAA